MKRYRLLKDLPQCEVGTIWRIEGDKIYTEDDTVEGSGTIVKHLNLVFFDGVFDEWFEEVEEVKRWEPQDGRMYYYLISDGSVEFDIYADIPSQNRLAEIGNCFGTLGDAETAAEKLKIIQRLRKDGLRAEKFSVSDKHITIDISYSVEAINRSDDIYDDLNTLLFGEAAE